VRVVVGTDQSRQAGTPAATGENYFEGTP